MKVVFAEQESDALDSIDVLVLSNNCRVSRFANCKVDVCIFENDNFKKALKLKNVKNLVSCGMSNSDTVSFSCISDSYAMLCIRRVIIFRSGRVVNPCEFRTCFDKTKSIYDNLVTALLEYLLCI